MKIDLSDYKEVPERIAEFSAKYPLGSLQGEGYFVRDPDQVLIGYHYTARAFRTPDDPRPGVGTAFEKIPGSTPYTKDSEVMNAETSAWGRAIVALGFSTKKIASAEEVRNRQPDAVEVSPPPPPASGDFPLPDAVQAELEQKAGRIVPTDGGVPEEVVMSFGKHAGKKMSDLLDAAPGYVKWLASDAFEPKNADQKRVRGAAITLLGGKPEPVTSGAAYDDDIPFAATWA